MNVLLPVNPATRICIPVIKRDIAITNATNSNPKIGDINMNMARAISIAPTPIVKPLSSVLCSLCVKP